MIPLPTKTLLPGPNGSVFIDALRGSVKGAILVPDSASQAIAPAARSGNAPGISFPVIIEGPSDAITEVFSTVGLHGSAVAADIQNRLCVTIDDNSNGKRAITNRPINVAHVFGTNQQPMFLNDVAEGMILKPQQTLSFVFYNTSTSGSANYSMSLGARKFQMKSLPRYRAEIDDLLDRKKQYSPYWFTMTQNIFAGSTDTGAPGVTIGASGTANVIFDNQTHLTLCLTCCMASAITTGVAGETTEIFAAELFMPRTDRPLQNRPVTFNCLAGSAAQPFFFDTPIIVPPKTHMRGLFTNLITDESSDVFFTFGGMAFWE